MTDVITGEQNLGLSQFELDGRIKYGGAFNLDKDT